MMTDDVVLENPILYLVNPIDLLHLHPYRQHIRSPSSIAIQYPIIRI